MMMTSGGGAKYKGSIDCAMQIMKNEGFMSMMKGAGANILWCRWCRCARWFRQVPGHVHCVENQPVRACCSRVVAFSIGDRQPMAKERRPCLLRQFGLFQQKLCRTSNNLVDLSMIVRL